MYLKFFVPILCLSLPPAGLMAQQAVAPAPDVRTELARALAQLAVSAERTTMGGRMGYAGDSLPDVLNLCRVVRFLATQPAAERYELLKEWMLPREPGALARNAMCFAPVDAPREAFFSGVKLPAVDGADSQAAAFAAGSDGVIYFAELLVGAATECGKLQELATAAEAYARSAKMANVLSVLTSLTTQQDSALAQESAKYVATLQQDALAKGKVRLEPWPTYMIARAWMRHDELHSQGEALARLLTENLTGLEQRSFLSYLHRDLALHRVRQSGGTLSAGADPGLELWHPGGYYFTSGGQAGTWPGWWVERDGVIVHVSGPEVSPLYFDYPLAGSFELSVDGYSGATAEAAVQYGRIVFEPFGRAGKARVLTIGERESLDRPDPGTLPDRFHQLAIRVTPERVRYLCNGVTVFDDERPSPTTPWLALLGRCTRTTAWRNLQLTGHPEIPREVELIRGDRMDGWMSPLYRENVPPQLRSTEPSVRGAASAAPAAPGLRWYAAEGVLSGSCNKSPDRSRAIQSWLAYHRPLRSGDALSYEFFFEPDEVMVHPALGRTALIFAPEGVRLHWITEVPHQSVGTLSPDHAVTIAEAQRGVRPLPLRAGHWNAITIRVTDTAATLELNGTAVYEHSWAVADNRMFGLFYYRNRTAAQVRHIVLKGNWPERLSDEQLAHPVARRDAAEAAASRQSRAAVVDESWSTRQ